MDSKYLESEFSRNARFLSVAINRAVASGLPVPGGDSERAERALRTESVNIAHGLFAVERI